MALKSSVLKSAYSTQEMCSPICDRRERVQYCVLDKNEGKATRENIKFNQF